MHIPVYLPLETNMAQMKIVIFVLTLHYIMNFPYMLYFHP